MNIRLQLLLWCILTCSQVYAQDSLVKVQSARFWEAFLKDDSLEISDLYATREEFWLYAKESYVLGEVQDTLKRRFYNIRTYHYVQFYGDIALVKAKAAKVYKIKWNKVELKTVQVHYRERNVSGFLYKSYDTSIEFIYKKATYSIQIDGFIPVQKGIEMKIYANMLTLVKR
ncbi:MAG: hypothetical protein U0U66_04810 [Cytophagaceae bacterium]